jgi:NADPH:quinone reductase-like Zn-dependent oxidoreductase
VLGLVGGGGYAEQIVVHEREASRVPDAHTDEAAAALPEAFLTAWDALVVQAGLGPGDVLLVHAAGSGVGSAAVQIGRALGCTVIGTSRTADKLARLAVLGMDHGIAVVGGRFADEVLASTGGAGADVVLDLVGGPYVPESIACARAGARLLVVGLTGGRTAEVDLGAVLRKRLRVMGTVMRARPIEEKIAAAELLDRRLGPLFARGALVPVVDRTFDLADAAEAHRHVASNEGLGKVLLRVG